MPKEKLHPKAEKLLAEVYERGGKVNAEELEKDDFSHSEIMRSSLWLEEEGLAETEEHKETFLELSRQGRNAYIKGLPEKRLIDSLDIEEERSMEDLKGKLKDVEVGIGAAKKNGWISITKKEDNSFVELTKEGKEALSEQIELEKALEKIQKTKSLEDGELKRKLEDRGLIKKKSSKEITIKLTEKGKKVAKEIDRVESVSQLDSELIKSGMWKDVDIREYDVEAPVEVIRPGKKHPYRSYLDKVRNKLMNLGFREVKTPLVELEFWNFDALFQAQDHPAREIHDKFELKDPKYGDLEESEIVKNVRRTHETGWILDSLGWGYDWSKRQASKLMLRSQNTASSVRELAEGLKSPAKVFAIDRVFRPDKIDKTHFYEFYQMEGIVKAEDLSLKNLLAYLKLFGEEVAGADKIRFRPGYFPFTEPSVEIDAYNEEIGWIELGGAGLFRPEVTRPLGVEDDVIAWGLGIDRLAMFKLGIDDIRRLVFPTDIEYIRNAPLTELR